MYEYSCVVDRVVDGDTVDVTIDLGFKIFHKARVRMYGIDTPESRTTDKVEKVFGLASKDRLKHLLEKDAVLITYEDKNGEDMKGKFGRILGDFKCGDKTASEILIEEGHAVRYHGQNKADVEVAHLSNRNRLMTEGVVDPKAVQQAQEEMK